MVVTKLSRIALVVGGLSVVAAATLPAAFVDGGLPVGKIALSGIANSWRQDTTSLTGEDTMSGTFTNDGDCPLGDVYMTLKLPENSTDSAPTMAGGDTLKVTGKGGGSNEGDMVDCPGGKGVGAHVSFTGTGGTAGAGPLKKGGSLSWTAGITGNMGDGSGLIVSFTGSGVNASSQEHFDVLETLRVTESAPGGVRSLYSPYNAQGGFVLINDSRARFGGDIVSLSGNFALPEGISLTGIDLQYPARDFSPVGGAQVALDGNKFTITGFSNLSPGGRFLLIGKFSGQPIDQSYRVLLEADFDSDF